MNDTALISQDSNRPSYSAIEEDFGESLDKIGLKIKNLQNELSSFTSKKKSRTNTFKDTSRLKISSKEKIDVHSKENRDQTPTKYNKKTSRTPQTYSKGTESTFRSLFENSLDITQSFGNIEMQENNDETAISQETREKLQRIFEFYSKFGDKGSPFQLRLSKYRKMMIDSGLVDSTSLEDLEVLFLGHNQHKAGIEFEAFLTLLQKIASTRYPLSSYTPEQALRLLLTRYIIPLNNQIESNIDLYNENGASTMRNEPVEEGVFVVLKSVYPILSKIYKEFFSWEIKGIESPVLLGHSEAAFWAFLKEFEICPGMITKTMGQSLWAQRDKSKGLLYAMRENAEIEAWFKKKDIGMVFKFTKFCEFLVSLSFMVYRSQGEGIQIQLNEAEQIAALLGKLQYTKGMAKFALKGSLIVPKETLKVVRKQSIIEDKLCLCPTEERTFGKEKLLNSLSEDEYGKQRNKIISEIHNRITPQ